MTIKDIVVALSVRADEDRGREYGLGMAAEFGAHVDGVIYALEPPPLFTINPEFVRGLMERHRAEARRSANTVGQAFEQASAAAGVRHALHVVAGHLRQADSDLAAPPCLTVRLMLGVRAAARNAARPGRFSSRSSRS